jgi:hypothetical protein
VFPACVGLKRRSPQYEATNLRFSVLSPCSCSCVVALMEVMVVGAAGAAEHSAIGLPGERARVVAEERRGERGVGEWWVATSKSKQLRPVKRMERPVCRGWG